MLMSIIFQVSSWHFNRNVAMELDLIRLRLSMTGRIPSLDSQQHVRHPLLRRQSLKHG